MNTLVIVLIAAVCLLAGYALYGRWLAKKWGIDPTAETPAVKHMYRPTDGPYLHISFLLSPEPVPSPVPFRQQHSDGFQYFSGSC